MSSMNILSLSFSSQSNLLLHQPPKFLNPRPHSLLRRQFFFPCQSLKPKILHQRTPPISPNAAHSVHSSPTPIDHFPKFLSQKFVVFLLGSFLLLGFTNRRPCLAMPAPNETEQMSEKLVEEDPTNVEALKVAVYAMMRRGKMKTAVKLVKELIKVEPNEVEWRLLEALCYETMGKLSEAKRLLEEILVEKPLLLRALHEFISFLLKSDPRIAMFVMHKNDEGPAVFEMLKKALELARRENKVTKERNIRILVAQMHVVKGKLDDGLKQFQDLVHDDPRDFRPYLCQRPNFPLFALFSTINGKLARVACIGIIYSLLDKKKEAQEQFEVYRSLVPDEIPQRGFLDDVVLEAKAKSREQLQKEFAAELSYKK